MNRSSHRVMLAAALLLAVLGSAVGCGYGPMSPKGNDLALTLYGLANRQAADRVEPVEEKIAAAEEAGELPAHEADWLRAICQQCRDGNWEAAQKQARQMMEDQAPGRP
ncbi:MAG: hypothetical protein AAGJ46_01315 [Planctomycetota bacterium]